MIGNFDDLAGRCFQNEPNIYLTALVFHCGVFPFKLVGRICGHVEITPSGSINCFPLSARWIIEEETWNLISLNYVNCAHEQVLNWRNEKTPHQWRWSLFNCFAVFLRKVGAYPPSLRSALSKFYRFSSKYNNIRLWNKMVVEQWVFAYSFVTRRQLSKHLKKVTRFQFSLRVFVLAAASLGPPIPISKQLKRIFAPQLLQRTNTLFATNS